MLRIVKPVKPLIGGKIKVEGAYKSWKIKFTYIRRKIMEGNNESDDVQYGISNRNIKIANLNSGKYSVKLTH